MTTPFYDTGYDRMFILDTQMVFKAHSLEQLDRATVSIGPLLHLVLSQVSSKIDAQAEWPAPAARPPYQPAARPLN